MEGRMLTQMFMLVAVVNRTDGVLETGTRAGARAYCAADSMRAVRPLD